MIGSKLGDCISRAESGRSGLVTLVPCGTACPFGGLLECINRQHAEAYRQRVPDCHIVEAPGRLTGDIVEVGSLAPDNGPKSNQARISAGACGRSRSGSQLECAWQPDDVDLVAGNPSFAAAGERAIEELLGDEFVVAAYEDRHSPGGAKAAGEVSHGQWVNKWPSLSRLTCR
jgi:hypothetical protein